MTGSFDPSLNKFNPQINNPQMSGATFDGSYFGNILSQNQISDFGSLNVPTTRGTNFTPINVIENSYRGASKDAAMVQDELMMRHRGEVSTGPLSKMPEAQLRQYLDKHLAYLNEIMPDVQMQNPDASMMLANEYGQIKNFINGYDYSKTPQYSQPYTKEDALQYIASSMRYNQITPVMQEIIAEGIERARGVDQNKRFNYLSNQQIYDAITYFQSEIFDKQVLLTGKAAKAGVIDRQTAYQTMDIDAASSGGLQMLRLAMSELGAIKPDASIQYINNYNSGYSPFSPRVPQYGGPGGGGQLGYVNPSPMGSAFAGGYGGNPQPYATMNYNTPQYQVNYYNIGR